MTVKSLRDKKHTLIPQTPMFTDIVGYTTLMGEDEQKAIRLF